MITGLDPEAFGKALGGLLADALNPLRKRLDALERPSINKSLDAAAYDEMGEMAERLQRMEESLSDLSDNGLRFRGFYRDGLKAKRGDAFTHDGSCWRAMRDTDDKPHNESPDWQLVARKGRDGK